MTNDTELTACTALVELATLAANTVRPCGAEWSSQLGARSPADRITQRASSSRISAAAEKPTTRMAPPASYARFIAVTRAEHRPTTLNAAGGSVTGEGEPPHLRQGGGGPRCRFRGAHPPPALPRLGVGRPPGAGRGAGYPGRRHARAAARCRRRCAGRPG